MTVKREGVDVKDVNVPRANQMLAGLQIKHLKEHFERGSNGE